MNKKIVTSLIILVGISLLVFGIIKAPVSNESELRDMYQCGRQTKQYLPTDKYCSNLTSAPEAEKIIPNPYMYAGVVLTALGIMYIFTTRARQNKT